MKEYNFCVNVDMFNSLIGKKFNNYSHVSSLFSNIIPFGVGVKIDDVDYDVINDSKEVDYLGLYNHACVCRIFKKVKNIRLMDDYVTIEKIDKVIKAITIVNDSYKTFIDGRKQYLWEETRAVIFHFDNDQELSFEKEDVYFSNRIILRDGTNLIDLVADGKNILSDPKQNDTFTIVHSREIIKL